MSDIARTLLNEIKFHFYNISQIVLREAKRPDGIAARKSIRSRYCTFSIPSLNGLGVDRGISEGKLKRFE